MPWGQISVHSDHLSLLNHITVPWGHISVPWGHISVSRGHISVSLGHMSVLWMVFWKVWFDSQFLSSYLGSCNRSVMYLCTFGKRWQVTFPRTAHGCRPAARHWLTGEGWWWKLKPSLLLYRGDNILSFGGSPTSWSSFRSLYEINEA